MKNLCLSLVAVTLLSQVAFAQDDQPAPYESGWFQATNATADSVEVSSIHPNLANPTYPDGTSPIAETPTLEIQALARNLQNDPARIFNYVHDHIRYTHYFGSHKGAGMTLLERSGNDFDQCALLVTLLRSAGIGASYRFGMVSIPYAAADQRDYQHWVGVTMPNTNWNNTHHFVSSLNGSFGYPYTVNFNGDTTNITFHHVWVVATVNGTNCTLDPAFKVTQETQGTLDLDSAMQLNTNTLITSASSGSTATADYVQNLNEANLRAGLAACNSNLVVSLGGTNANASVDQILGGRSIVSSAGQPLGQATPFTTQTQGAQWPVSTWNYIPTNLMAVLKVNLPGTNNIFYMPGLAGSRLSIVCTTNGVAQLEVDDTVVTSVQTTGTGATFTPLLAIQHPFGTNWDFSVPGFYPSRYADYDESVSTQAYQRTNATYVLLYGIDANSAWLTQRQRILDGYRQQYPDSSQQVKSETLNVMGLNWLLQSEQVEQLVSRQTGTIDRFLHRLGRVAQENGKGYYIDIYEQLLQSFSNNSLGDDGLFEELQAFQISSYFASAMEHGIIEQLQSSNLVAASTVKLIQLASTNSQKIYLASSNNWTNGATVSRNITSYDTNQLYTLYISQGDFLLLPQSGAIQVAGTGSWKGQGYVACGQPGGNRLSVMNIGGGYNGGFSGSSAAVLDSGFIALLDSSQSTFFSQQSATISQPTMSWGDPVSMVDGSFEVSSTDLALGGQEPRGLNLARFYSSSRRNSNLAAMAPGWLHNYYVTAVPTSATAEGLGSTTPRQMAPMLVAIRAALGIYNNAQPSPKTWVITALIAKWGIDQLINNGVAVTLGKDTLEFVKQPDGSYTPPANATQTLIRTNGAYWLTERHGRTFKFNTNGLLATITDPYGQSLTVGYDTSNRVHTVTDWKAHMLTFTYTGANLTSVSDGTRSVSYGYSGGNLTSFTDTEGKTSTYAYDSQHQIIGTLDALSNPVVTNFYDAFGRITVQLTQGSSNKLWQVFASGFGTVQIDPAEGRQEYTFDSKSRQIGFQDALGNLSQTVYDGQDHVIMTVSPLNETNRSVFDANNNLIATIDPLGFSNQFSYDSQNNLTATIDPRGNTNRFGYNAQFSLTGSTNAAGDFVSYAYNSDGTLFTKTDSAGATTYAYSSDGYMQKITYPGTLGSEGFMHDVVGNIIRHTNALAFVTTNQFNTRRQLTNSAASNIVTKVTYDAIGNVASTIDARGFVTSNTWSTTRHLLSTIMPATPAGTAVVSNAYDGRDWIASTRNAFGKNTFFTNDAAQHLIAAADPLGRISKFGFDLDGRQTASTNGAGEVTRSQYNSRGQLTNLVDAALETIGKSFDAAGNQIFLTNRNSKRWQFQFDAVNRLTNTISPLGFSNSATFNHQGLVSSTKDAKSQTNSLYYDAKGRLTNRVDNLGTTTFGYNSNDCVTTISESGLTNSSAYDPYGRVSSYTDALGNQIQYRYDANGNLTNLIYPGNRIVNYFYDSLNRLTNVTDWLSRKTYLTYDIGGRLTLLSRPNNTQRSLNYNDDGEVTNIIEQTTAGMPIALWRFAYNSNATVQWEFSAPLPTNAPPGVTNTYDDDNRLLSCNGTNVSNDANGNMTSGPGTNSTFLNYTFDPRNRLTTFAGVTNAYDPSGSRAALVYGTNVVSFVVNPNASLPQVIMRIRNGVTNYYIYGAGLLYEITETATSTNTHYYHFDSRGSTVALTDGSGNITDRIQYSAYATILSHSGVTDTPFLYNGKYGVQADPNGLLYMQARFYNPYICRFINSDPSGFSGGLNFYAYAAGNPVSLMDPFGLCPTEGWGGATATWINQNITAPLQRFTDSPYNPAPGLTDFLAYNTGGLADILRVGQGTANATYNAQDGYDVAIGITEDIGRATGLALIVGGGLGTLTHEGAPAPGYCFAAGTKVSTPDGDVDIEEISTGDIVYAYNFEGRKVVEETVEETHQNFTYHWVEIKIGGETILATKSHPFWVESEQRWFKAVDLKAGMELRSLSGKFAAIISVEVEDLDQPQITYNFEVSHQHDYFVGRTAILVHNGPNFIVSPNGTVFPVPNGATGPGPVNSGKGFSFTGGSGGNGLGLNTTGVRIMDPTPQYPNGYGVYMNSATPTAQTVDPYTGKPISFSNPNAHIPCN